eukprot:scaffold35989_cov84-Isochrysis_galbana.AAC.5
MWIPSCCPLQAAHAEEGLRAARRFALALARASSSQRRRRRRSVLLTMTTNLILGSHGAAAR